MSKKILIVTDCFPPNFAPRMGILSSNLEKMGYDVTIISEDNSETHYALEKLPQNTNLYNYQSSLSRAGYYFKTALNLFFDHKSRAFSTALSEQGDGENPSPCSLFTVYQFRTPQYIQADILYTNPTFLRVHHACVWLGVLFLCNSYQE